MRAVRTGSESVTTATLETVESRASGDSPSGTRPWSVLGQAKGVWRQLRSCGSTSQSLGRCAHAAMLRCSWPPSEHKTYDWCITSASEARALSRNQCQPSNSQGRTSWERQFQPSDMDTMQSPHTCLCREQQSAPLIDPKCQRLAFVFTLQCNSCPGRSQSDVSLGWILKPQGSKDSGGFFLSLVPTRQRSMVYTMGTQAQVLGLNGLGL